MRCGLRILLSAVIFALSLISGTYTHAQEKVEAIKPPTKPLPDEAASRDVKRFSFIVYGDTRGRRDGSAVQYEHSLLIDSMLAQIKKRATGDYPVGFVLQSGDAVVDGRDAKQWNISFV